MKILITGGAGFIGSHLVDRLLAEGHIVTVLDNFSTGKRKNLTDHQNLKVVHADIFDMVHSHFRKTDIVFHLAALTRPQWSILHPIEANVVNVEGTLKVFNYCKKYGVKRVVFTSSSSLYGTPTKFPTPETEPPRPLSPYGIQKYMGELYAKLFERMYGLEVNCIRPFNVYGPRQNPLGGYAAAVPKFIDQLNRNEAPSITGDGTQSRDFTYVGDIVDILIKAATSKVFGESFNAGGGKSISINDLYEMIRKFMNKDIEAKYIDPVLEPYVTLADTSKAKELLGWQPRVGIHEGIRLTVEATLNE